MHRIAGSLFLLLLFSVLVPAQSPTDLPAIADSVTAVALRTLRRSVTEIGDTLRYPSYGTKDLHWKLVRSSDWVAGFWPGTLWYAYELSGDAQFRTWAEQWTNGLEKEKTDLRTHDLGFKFYCSYGNGLRLMKNDPLVPRYRDILLTAAATLDKRFVPTVGMYSSNWDKKPLPHSVPAIVDIMMNLELLFWSGTNSGDPSVKERCISHALTTYRDFVRPDGSTFHIVRYDSASGSVLNKGQIQGDVDSSTWSRGHAWTVYGMVMTYRFTKDPRFLAYAQRTADYFLAHLPQDGVARWDFLSPIDIRDASASAIVCSALFELQGYMTDTKERERYRRGAEWILRSLCQPPYFSRGEGTNALLLHSTQYFHATENTDVPSTFADYYFLESLLRYRALRNNK